MQRRAVPTRIATTTAIMSPPLLFPSFKALAGWSAAGPSDHSRRRRASSDAAGQSATRGQNSRAWRRGCGREVAKQADEAAATTGALTPVMDPQGKDTTHVTI